MVAEGHAQNLQSSVLSIKYKTDLIRNEIVSMQTIFNNVNSMGEDKSVPREDAHANASSSYSRSRYDPERNKFGGNSFEDKLEKYK